MVLFDLILHYEPSTCCPRFLTARAEPRATTTEQCAFIATASDTLPNRNLLNPRLPCEPTTMRSAFHFFASVKMTSFGLPERIATVGFNPAEARTCSALSVLVTTLLGLISHGSSTVRILNSLPSGQGRLESSRAAFNEVSEPSVASRTLLTLCRVFALPSPIRTICTEQGADVKTALATLPSIQWAKSF